MIHFDFIVDDGEAEIIFDGVSELILRSRVKLTDDISDSEKDWHRRHIAFLENLKSKMTNQRVE